MLQLSLLLQHVNRVVAAAVAPVVNVVAEFPYAVVLFCPVSTSTASPHTHTRTFLANTPPETPTPPPSAVCVTTYEGGSQGTLK